MSQDEINTDLKNYIGERKKAKPIWEKVFNKAPRPKEEVQEDIKQDLEKAAENENITPEDKQELEKMEEKIDTVNTIENEIEERIAVEHESLLKRFFKKLRSEKSSVHGEKSDNEDIDEDDNSEHSHDSEGSTNPEHISREEMKEFLKKMHHWITQLSPETQAEFKNSEDFAHYTKMLKKYDLIKG